MTAAVLYDKEDQIVTITLNRPEALNSINRQLKQELNEAITTFDRDDGVRVAIITGAGRAFCAGRDLKERAADIERYVWGMFPDGASVESQLISSEDLH